MKSLKKELSLEEKFVNYVMQSGKKSTAQRIFADMLNFLTKKGQKDPLQTFKDAIENVCPSIEVRPKRVGGAVYQIPVEVMGARRTALGFRWLIAAAKARKGKPMANRLGEEIMAALENQGGAIKKKDDVHKMAKANKAFAHYARYAR